MNPLTSTRNQATAAPAEGRKMPKVGDIVMYTIKPQNRLKDSDRETTAALVVRVNSPDDPETNLGLMVASLVLGEVRLASAVPYSPTLRSNHWSWGDGIDIEPYYGGNREKDLANRKPGPADPAFI